jgi:serine/threonine protein kinase
MHHSSNCDTLEPRDRDVLRELKKQLEAAWERNEAQDLDALLHEIRPPLRLPFLCELIKTDLEIRIRRLTCNGEHVQLEDYLQKYPALGSADSLPADLLYAEYRARQLYGDQPALSTYQRRFPGQFTTLKRLVAENPFGTLNPGGDGSTLPSAPPLPSPEPATVAHGAPRASDARALAPPTGTGEYTLGPYIARGAYGEVYFAKDRLGKEVAYKRTLYPIDHDAAQRELKSLDQMKNLRHPFLLSTFTWFIDKEDKLCMVMELAERTLTDRFKECKAKGVAGIPREELLRYIADAAEALDFLHKNNVIHRDIKPTNLLLLQGRVKVADFGVVGLFRENQELGTTIGTPLYLAPEVWGGAKSVEGDQYSLARTFIELSVGQDRLKTIQPSPGLDSLDGFTTAERKVLARALGGNPKERYPSCTAFVHALREASAPPQRRKPPVWSWLLPLTLAAVLVGLAAWLIAIGFLRPPEAPSTSAPAPSIVLPEGWEVKEEGDDPLWPKSIVCKRLRNCAPIEFLLVKGKPTGKGGPQVPPFYVMKTLVTNEQFQAALKDPEMGALLEKWRAICPEAVQKQRPPPGPASARKPVLNVTAVECHCFAVWLGGKLPSGVQWDKARGRWTDKNTPIDPGMINDNREFTATVFLETALYFPGIVEQKNKDKLLELRGGRDFRLPKPGDDSLPDSFEYWKPPFDIGFRVVFEPGEPGIG